MPRGTVILRGLVFASANGPAVRGDQAGMQHPIRRMWARQAIGWMVVMEEMGCKVAVAAVGLRQKTLVHPGLVAKAATGSS